MKRVLLVLSLLLLNGATCLLRVPNTGDLSGNNQTETRKAGLLAFKSAEEARAYFADQAIAQLAAQQSYGGGIGCAAPAAYMDMTTGGDILAPTANGAEDSQGGSRDSFSTTNVQESGVDESDLLKNDGEYLYMLKDNSVRIVKAVPPDGLEQVASIDLPSTANSLYLRGDRLIALSHSWGYWGYIDIMPVAAGAQVRAGGDTKSQTTVTVIDITDRTKPTKEATLKFDGDIVSSRLIMNKLHLVMTAMPDLPANPTPENIRAQPLEAWLPNFGITDASSGTQGGDAVGWATSYYPANADGYGITMVITLDVDNPTGPFQSESIVANAGTIYASTSALYVTDTKYDYSGSYREDTVVHKFDLTGDGAEYKASGLVPGRLLNQYSLGEKDGYLRMASSVEDFGRPVPLIMLPFTDSSALVETTQATTGTETTSGHAVYVLHEGDTTGKLDIVGRLEGIAPDERLYSARFVGDRGFLVTFKRIDPLFTIDLTDPTNPTLAGELKVPGFSEYIHLMDHNHLLTIGRDAVDMGGDWALFGGVQLSIFDITDFANPKRLHTRTIGVRGTTSEAAQNPKAFNYFASKNALAIPLDLYEGDGSSPFEYGAHTFSGVVVYRVTVENGFSLLGRISTQVVNPYCDWCGYGWSQYIRGVFIGDNVYAATDRVVKAAALADPSSVLGSLTLP